MKHNFHERKQNRIQYAQERIRKNKQKAATLHKVANYISDATQGEPVKIGHHSEKRHRKDLEKMDNAMRGAIDASDKADYYAGKIHSIENNNSISSDDPDALKKLREKLEKLLKRQEMMKAVNKAIKKGDQTAFLTLPGGTEKLWEEYNKCDFLGRKGFPAYELTNNNGNINRIRNRIAEMEKANSRTTEKETIKGIQLIENVEANRIQLIFTGKPSEDVRRELKSLGFKWSPSEGAWQRLLNDQGIRVAKSFLQSYTPER